MLDELRKRLQSGETITLAFRVRAHASHTGVHEVLPDGTVVMDIAAPANEGKANLALIRFLADALNIPQSHILIAKRSLASKRKTVKLIGKL